MMDQGVAQTLELHEPHPTLARPAHRVEDGPDGSTTDQGMAWTWSGTRQNLPWLTESTLAQMAARGWWINNVWPEPWSADAKP